MEFVTLNARLATFAPPTKRSKSGWPHSTPKPEDLAKAGFYYKPQGAGSDNTICFLCERSLDGWEEDDNPFQEHFKHSQECAWAVLMGIGQTEVAEDINIEDPTDERLAEARRATFALGWPHESKRGWVCKIEKMVEAGWHFEPSAGSEDFVSCAYCKLSLDGWEPKDNPFDEHYRRSPDCTFFVYAGTTAPSNRPKAKRGRTSKASRVSKGSRTSKVSSRLSTQSNMSLVSEITSIPDLDESIDSSTTSINSTTSTASTAATRGKRKATSGRSKKTKTKRTKSTKTQKPETDEVEKEHVNVEVHSPIQSDILPDSKPEEEEQPVEKPSKKSKTKKTQAPVVEIEYPQLEDKPIITEVIDNPAEEEAAEKSHLPTPPRAMTRSPSAHSDIENAPPSTRRKSSRPPLPTYSSPAHLAPKWDPVDIDLVFQTTPGVQPNPFISVFSATAGNTSRSLSETEKGMTVQEWIEHIAGQAETELRAEGERAVGVFEREGARAMNVLEGITCA